MRVRPRLAGGRADAEGGRLELIDHLWRPSFRSETSRLPRLYRKERAPFNGYGLPVTGYGTR